MSGIPSHYQGAALRHTWTYQSLEGKPLAVVARYDEASGKKVVVPFMPFNGSGWKPGALPEPRPLYGLDALAAADPSGPVLVVEGEKAAQSLCSLGVLAVTSLGGSKAPSKTDWTPLSGRSKAYILPDHDQPGREYARDVCAALEALERPPTLFLVELPGLPDKGDVVDWLQARLPGWDGYAPIPETDRPRLVEELRDTASHAMVPVPAEWLRGHDPIEWGKPGMIEPRLLPVEPLPPGIIPEPYRKLIVDASERLQTPPDFIATTAIAVTGSLIGAGCSIRPKERDSWEVIPNTWSAAVGRPSVVLKTPSMGEIMSLLSRLQAEAGEAYDTAVHEQAFESKLAAAKAKESEKQLAKAVAGNKTDEIEEFREKHNQAEEQPEIVRRIFKTNETSIQSQTVLQSQNPRGILTFRDELTGLLTRWERREFEDERAYFLEGFNGNGSYTDYKVGRGLTDAKNICISLIGGIQPDKLLRYLRQTEGGGNDGMLQRFQLATYPDEPQSWCLVDKMPDIKARSRVFDIMRALAYQDFTEWGATQGEYDDRPYFRFDAQGQAVFNEWLTDLQLNKIRNEENPLIAEHLGKYRSLMPSLALIFHLIEMADGSTTQGAVTERCAINAAAWCDYLESHARRIYGMAASPERIAAAALAEKIQAGAVTDDFSAKDIYDKHWSGLKEPEDVTAACDVLVGENWLAEYRPQHKRGRRPLPRYRINPVVLEGFQNV